MKILAALNGSPRLKRALDIAGALAGLVFSAPVMLAAAVYIRLTMGRGLLFRQQRSGKDAASFTLFKFRTMRDGAHLPDRDRLTGAGILLRSFSIDELPQFWNVLRGDMSLVGPRPLLPHYAAHYTAEQRRRLEVKPGLTGWAQVHGRNALDWEEKFRLDTWYVDNACNALDLRIMLQTVVTILTRNGINQAGAATVAMFAPLCEGSERQ
jgi:lipopolysaccharide/colanic/teichoic acid biosynthesis glycosyltransferase